MRKLRKFLIVSIMVLTVVAMSGVGLVSSASASASAGDLIKMDGLSSVYYLGADGKRYVFPNETTYFSWYSDWSNVVTVPASELQSYPIGGNIVMRPGTKLVKITTDPSVYAVQPNGVLRKITSEAQATALYGTNWNQRVVDVPDAFFTNYTIGSPLADGEYPVGSLIKNAGSSDIYYYDGTNYRKFTSEAVFTANGFKMEYVLTGTVTGSGADITSAEFVDTAQAGGTTNPTTGTGLMVSLSSNTAPASTLVYGQALANLATFNFTASNDGAVKVTSLKIKRTGVSSDNILTDVYLYNGSNRLTDNASVSDNYITFNNPAGLFTIAAGSTMSITVKSDISDSSGDGSEVAVAIMSASDVTSDGVVSGSFPMTGNKMSISDVDLATVSMGTTSPSSDTDVDAGETDYTVWKNKVNVGVRDVNLERITLRQIGSINYTDLKDLKFYVNGVQYGSAMQLGSDNYVTFDFSNSPILLKTGSRTLEVRADVVGGSSNDFSFSLQRATDLAVKDTDYGVYVKVTGTMPAATGTVSVNNGTMTVVKSTESPSGDVVKDASNVSLGKFEFKAYGESIKIEHLKVHVDYTGHDVSGDIVANHAVKLRNGALYVNGSQIGSTTDLDSGSDVDFSLGSSLIVNPGTPVIVEVQADLYDNDGTGTLEAGDKIQVGLSKYTNNAERLSSLGYFSAPDVVNPLLANELNVKVGTLSLSKQTTYGDQSIVVPQTAYKLGSFVLTGDGIEDTNIDSFEVTFTGTDDFTVSKLSDVYLKYGSKTTSIKSTVSSLASWSVSDTLGKNDNMVVEIYGTIDSSAYSETNADTMQTKLKVYGTTVDSSQSVDTGTAVDGQTITATVGSISASVDSSTPAAALVVANSTVDLAAYKFDAENDTYTITKMVLTVPDEAAASNISEMQLKDGSSIKATAPITLDSGTYQAVFNGLNIIVPANDNKVLTAAAVLSDITTGTGSTGADLKATLASYKASNSEGIEDTYTPAISGKDMYVYKSVPTIANQDLPTTILTAGTKTLAKFSISSDVEPISWNKVKFNIDKSNEVTLSNFKVYDESNVEINGSFTVSGTSATLNGGDGANSTILTDSSANFVNDGILVGSALTIKTNGGSETNVVTVTEVTATVLTFASTTFSNATVSSYSVDGSVFTADNEQDVSGTKTYSLKATVGGTIDSNYYVSTNIDVASGHEASAKASDVSDVNFVWSDQSATSHDTGTNDWTNNYLANGFATDSQTLTAN